jgi:hypothetical protein
MILIQTIKIMASFSAFVHFCAKRIGCDKGGLYATAARAARLPPIKIGYSFNLLRRMADWEYNFPEGIDILAVARMNRPNDTHFHKRRVLQLAEALLKQELRQYVVTRVEWLQQWAKAATLAAMRRLQLSLSPNLAGRFFDAAQIHFFDAAQIQAPWEHALVSSGTRGRRSQPNAAASTRRQRQEPPAPVVWPCHLRRKGVEPKCEADALCRWERSPQPRGRGKYVATGTPARDA